VTFLIEILLQTLRDIWAPSATVSSSATATS
jgi:hypothetical protein